MNRKLISKALGNINGAFIEESLTVPEKEAHRSPERTKHMGKYENTNAGRHTRRLSALILAACLVFALAITAYAANLFGIREMLGTGRQKLPEAAEPYIQHHTETAAAEDWSARVTESLCDTGRIITTVTVSGGDKYMIVPTDAMPSDSVGIIGMEGNKTLSEYAAEQGRELLFVGASLMRNEHLGIFTEAQQFVNVSATEMNILVQSERSAGADGGEAICRIYAIDEDGNQLHLEVPFTLEPMPTEDERVYVPAVPDAIPGIIVGNATVEESPMGLSVRWMETVTDQDAMYEIMKVEVEGVEFAAGGGTVLEDDGNWYYSASSGQGEIGDTMTVNFYDWDKVIIGSITFDKQ